MLDSDSAALHNEETKALLLEVKRIIDRFSKGKKYDQQFKAVFEAIRQLMKPAEEPEKDPIGFHTLKKTISKKRKSPDKHGNELP